MHGESLLASLGPGAVLPVVCEETTVRLTAVPTTYELTLQVRAPGTGDVTLYR